MNAPMFKHLTRLTAWMVAIAVGSVALLTGCSSNSDRQEIVIIEHSWESAALQPQIVAHIIEHGYGSPVSTLLVEPLAIQAALSSGSAEVVMEIWLPNNVEIYNQALESGSAIDVGESIADTWQGFGVPQYFKDANPGLESVFDLPDYTEEMSTIDSDGKIRFVDCVPGWACEVVNVQKWEGYGLAEHIHSVKPGSEAALVADLSRSYALNEPWFGYIWGPSIVSIDYEMYVLDEPEYTDECWETDRACGYPITEVKKLVAPELEEREPDVVEFLRQWFLSTEELVTVTKWMADNHSSTPDGALYYLREYPQSWKQFVPADVAAKVEESLSSIPDAS